MIVRRSHGIAFHMRELSFNSIPTPALLVQICRGHCTKTMGAMLAFRIPHGSQRAVYCVFGHRAGSCPGTRKYIPTITSQGINFVQNVQGLPGQRYNMRPLGLHLFRRYPPFCTLKIYLPPFCVAQLPRTSKNQRGKAQRTANNKSTFVPVHGPEQGTYFFRIRDRRKVFGLHRPECPLQIGGLVPFCTPGCNGVSVNLADYPPHPMCCL